MTRPLLLLLQLGISASIFGQARNANWVFSAGMWMSFSDTNMTILPSPYSGPARTACISDTLGQFQLLVDDTGIRNALFNTLQGATAVDLDWSGSAANYLILPKPGTAEHYFIFINESPPLARGGFVEVDLVANGGAGAVVGNSTTWYMDHVTAKLSATTDAAEEGYWIVQHSDNNDAFQTYHLSDQGLELTPVVSNVGGSYLADTPGHENADRWGTLTFSFQGDKLALIKHGSDLDTNALELFHFDRSDGTLEFWAHLTPQVNIINGDGEVIPWFQTTLFLTGCEFDPDGFHLYVNHYMEEGVGNIYIAQMDLSDPAPDAIQRSAFEFKGIIGNSSHDGYDPQGSELLFGTDNRLYARGVSGNLGMNQLRKMRNIPTLMSYLSGPNVVVGIPFTLPTPQLLTDSFGGFPNLCKRYLDSAPLATAIEAETMPVRLRVRPNPMAVQAILEMGGTVQATSIRWHDVLGHVVQEVPVQRSGPSLVLERNGLPAGLYMVEPLVNGRSLGMVRVLCE